MFNKHVSAGLGVEAYMHVHLVPRGIACEEKYQVSSRPNNLRTTRATRLLSLHSDEPEFTLDDYIETLTNGSNRNCNDSALRL